MRLFVATVSLVALTFGACSTVGATNELIVDDRVSTRFADNKIAALDVQMKQFVIDGHVYGIHTRLVHGNKIISETKAGLRDVTANKAIEDDTIYRIYSMTKPITGVAMMQLYEQGKWSLDDPITKFIPEFESLEVLSEQNGSLKNVSLERPPTMAELMSHTAGFAYGLEGTDPANEAFRDQKILRSANLNSMITKIAEVPLLSQPGSRWDYSVAVDIQGAIIERISGQTLGEYFQGNIFKPLGMKDTAFYVAEDKYDRFSQVFGFHPETKQLVPVPHETVMYKKETIALESGGGGLTSTMADYAAFCQAMLNGGTLNGVQIMKPETIELMTSNFMSEDMKMWSRGNLDETQADGLGFGLGFGIVTDPSERSVPYGQGTYFWGGAAGTWFWIDPVNDLYFIGMIQLFDNGAPEKVDFRTISAQSVYNAIEK